MSNEVNEIQKEVITKDVVVNKPQDRKVNTQDQNQRRGGRGNDRQRFDRKRERNTEKDPFETKLVHVRRVTKMYKGGRRLKLSVVVVVGDKKGKVGIGTGKGLDVKGAQEKAVAQAKKNMVLIPLKGNTIPHEVLFKFKSSRILLKPAAPGTGIVAGSSVRMVAEVAGVNDVLSKILGANNKITNAYAAIYALKSLRSSKL